MISLPRKIFGLYLTGALNANNSTYSVGEEWSRAPGQSREWTNLTARKHPVKFIFIFGPSSPVSLSHVAIQAVTYAKTQNFCTSGLALNSQASWWQQRLSRGCHHVHHAPWISHSRDRSPSTAPRTGGTHAVATLKSAKQKGTPSSTVVKCGICCCCLTKLWTLANSTQGCKVNPVCNMQPYVMQRRCIGSCLPRPFTKPICILRQAVIKLGIAK